MASQPVTDDAIRERHGCRCIDASDSSPATITIWEGEEFIYVDKGYHDRRLTQWQARYLASKLYRLSRRIRQRGEVA